MQYQLKGVSLLPRAPTTVYAQLPYEAITESQYRAAMAGIKRLDLAGLRGRDAEAPDKFCDAEQCETPAAVPAEVDKLRR